jgi:cbb3-type cytochrome oxidase cytochrome c subunit/cytochrome c553
MGNFVPELVPGARGAAFSGLWIHDAVGLFVTPLALAITYFVIPAATGRPIFSHFLSMLGFWLLFFVYPLNGTHHYVFSVIPMNAQLGAVLASTLLGVDVLIVVANLLLSLRGSGWVARDPALRFVALSTVFYLAVSVQGSLQAQLSINQAVHFSDWVIGHSHLAMLGFATFAAAGGLVHAWQRIPGARYNARAIEWAFWLLTAGVVLMAVDLTLAGIVEARLWQSSAPWLDSVRAAKPFWRIRALSAIPIVAGFGALLDGLTGGPRNSPVPIAAALAKLELPVPTRGLPMAYLSASVAGVAFFALSIALLAIWPGRVLEQQTRAMSPDHPLTLSVSEERGRRIYAREGCAYCHTQQVRFLQADMTRFGAPTLAWETHYDYPHLWGTRRIGPDLARQGGTRSEDWQFAHLFAPRAVVRDSVMPAYRGLFDGAPERPRQEARDLAAYLETLGRARELAGPEGEARAREICLRAGDEMALLAFQTSGLNANPARSRRSGDAPTLRPAALAHGRTLYLRNCASCHGARGEGDGPGAQSLHPPPANLAAHQYTTERVGRILWNGSPGTAMPAWRDLAPADLASLAAAVRELSTVGAQPSADLDRGARLYAANCEQCHGARGAGDGPAVRELHVLPHDFRGSRPTHAEAMRALREGVEGTRMAPWSTRLSDDDLTAVAAYLRTFFEEPR